MRLVAFSIFDRFSNISCLHFNRETQAGLEPAHNAFAERRVDQLRHWVAVTILYVVRDFVYFLAVFLSAVDFEVEEGDAVHARFFHEESPEIAARSL